MFVLRARYPPAPTLSDMHERSIRASCDVRHVAIRRLRRERRRTHPDACVHRALPPARTPPPRARSARASQTHSRRPRARPVRPPGAARAPHLLAHRSGIPNGGAEPSQAMLRESGGVPSGGPRAWNGVVPRLLHVVSNGNSLRRFAVPDIGAIPSRTRWLSTASAPAGLRGRPPPPPLPSACPSHPAIHRPRCVGAIGPAPQPHVLSGVP